MSGSASFRRPRLIALAATVAAVAAAGAPAVTATSAAAASTTQVKPIPASAGHVLHVNEASPLSTTECQAKYHSDCYGPTQYQAAYDTAPLYDQGIDGSGRTIVIVDSFGSPTVQHDLEVFDKQYGLADTQVQVQQWGSVPAFDPKNKDMTDWAGETTLDVEYAHAMAPGAKIVLIETGVSETEGTQGFPEIMDAVKDVAAKGTGDIVSLSLGATEDTFAEQAKKAGDYHLLNGLRYGLKAAADHDVTVLAASGDAGATDKMLDGKTSYTKREVGWPASDPLVTGVGGTRLHLDDQGNRLSPDVVWNDGDGSSAGGGSSRVFNRPAFQDGVSDVAGSHRAVPDISLSASPAGGAWVYSSYDPAHTGWEVIGGTSQATPMFAGIVALADQAAGKRLGNINPALYQLAESQSDDNDHGIVDVTSGNNSTSTVTGFSATEGYDRASGWGTVDAYQFVKSLAGRDDL
ncbi:subtilase family serine protease [Kitasatospora sp. MAA4]|uniref:S53 family peptidase n=1 Tax=Kitasatospora sp. MAA4 TaxID=3035093 RepID=UPI002474DFC3|nr:S53 family peptidase [Kitasatospora sp. MAA4]MDH6130702.1 subtilase family serine protease [Kitasatospora sp. MAA4]